MQPTRQPGHPPELTDNQVHLWWADPDEAPEPDGLAGILSPLERSRAAAFHFEADRRQYVAAHLLLRLVLAAHAGCPPGRLRFGAGLHDKPSLHSPSPAAPLEFNITHTRGLVACALARHPIGVDAEWLERPVAPALVDAVLHPGERDELRRWPAAARPRRLLEYWTLKESFLKATGLGLSLAPDTFALRLSPGEAPRLDFPPGQPHDAGAWQLLQVPGVSPRHCVALTVRLDRRLPLALEVRRLSCSAWDTRYDGA
jgi:4'-phosphopantetheinyl transferase